MQGLAGLGYEVVDMPMLNNERGVASMKNAADMLADFGRNGDTYVVHAAEGETVVPLEVLDANPKLKSMLFSQMQDMGIEPERYIVGNELNSINPVTGQPEFFIKKLFKAVKKTVKRVGKILKKIAPIVLPIVAPFMLPMMPVAFATGLGSLAGGLISGQSLGDALKGAVISGGLAGISNVAFRGGDFLGSMSSPTVGAGGLADIGQQFTFQNPFDTASNVFSGAPALESEAIKAPIGADGINPAQARLIDSVTQGVPDYLSPEALAQEKVRAAALQGVTPDVAAQAAQAAQTGAEQVASISATPNNLAGFAGPANPNNLTPVDQLVTGTGAASDAVASLTQPEGYFTNLKKAFTPGDDYGFADFYRDSLSPSRASIQPNMAQVNAEAASEAAKQIATQNEALRAAGLPELSASAQQQIVASSLESATKAAGPGLLAKYGPLAGTAVGAGITSDALLGTNIFTTPDVGAPGLVSRETGFDYLRKDPARFGFDTAEFFGDNPYYSRFAQTDDDDDVEVTGLAGLADAAAPFTAANFVNQYLGPQSRSVLPIAAKQGGEIVGPGTGTSDSIPALLSDGEFVITAKAVKNAGGGDRKKGAQRMYDFMRNLENGAA
tara:strand:- start:1835 stop:3670 length:1836 start_codon:yes stop_codon:yes gene_type:complete